ncbi:hypothetical protein NLI96_g5035 [Meripilus lineatus]|uniref:Transmembrane protein n=1 Tax=Meripilus lineatus TaxID=2056292 RepID=A0AAD5V5V2_9APHY|nr:hypothetical protein NLI96_g5035 [Physisporinus lineatus]
MVNWTSPEQRAANAVALLKLIHVFAGFYFWEFLTSLDFEWSFLRGRRKFTWPMASCGSREINCQAYLRVIGVSIMLSFSFATLNLAIRAAIIFSTCMDLIALVLCAWKVLPKRSYSVPQLMFKDGLVYFVVAFVLSIPLAVLALLNLNTIMNFIFIGPAATINTTVASRAVRRLSTFTTTSSGPTVYVTGSGPQQPSRSLRCAPWASSNDPRGLVSSPVAPVIGIRVDMETYTSSVVGGIERNGRDETSSTSSSRDTEKGFGEANVTVL